MVSFNPSAGIRGVRTPDIGVGRADDRHVSIPLQGLGACALIVSSVLQTSITSMNGFNPSAGIRGVRTVKRIASPGETRQSFNPSAGIRDVRTFQPYKEGNHV